MNRYRNLLTNKSFYSTETLQSKAFQTLNEYPDGFKFDLIIYDFSAGPCLLGFMHKFKYPPLIAVTAFTNPSFTSDFMGGSQYYSYVPHTFLPYTVDMNFWQRINNFVMLNQEY